MNYHIDINIPTQQLCLFDSDKLVKQYTISSGKNGVGELNGSEQTPRGKHIIRAKIGAGMPANAVFVGRRATGEIYDEQLGEQNPGRDWILTRIMWLSGVEPGMNRLGNVDTMRRYVYLHGTPDSVVLGQPGSRGCIRMANEDIIELFDLIPAYTTVLIRE